MPHKITAFKEAAGKRLRTVREALDLNGKEFADAIGISKTRLSNWEAGRHTPDPELLLPIKHRYGLSFDWLYANDPKGLHKDLADKVLRPRVVPAPANRPGRLAKTGSGKA